MIATLRSLALFQIFGLPAVVYGGLLTFSSFAFTALIGYTNYKGKGILPFKWHPRMVIISFTIATVHALLALSIFL
jgi:hypothetical protein